MNGKKALTDKHKFRIAHKEALIGCALALINIIWWYGFAYGLGSKPPEEYHYIFGLPAWFFMSCVVGFLVMILLVILVVTYMMEEVSFEEMMDHEGVGENENGY